MRRRNFLIAMLSVVVVLVVAGILGEIILSSHDEPIVIENGPILIKRFIKRPAVWWGGPPQKRDAAWVLHHSQPFNFLRVWTWETPQDTRPGYAQFPLARVTKVTLKAVVPGSGGVSYLMSFAHPASGDADVIFTPGVDMQLKPYIGDGLGDFFRDWRGGLEIPGGDTYRITEIQLEGQDPVCLREQKTPVQQATCEENRFNPSRVYARICVDVDKCSLPVPAQE